MPEDVWDALRDFGALHTRLVPGFVTDTKLDGDARIVTFANGTVAREVLVDCDDKKRRLVYAIKSERLTQHCAPRRCSRKATDAAAWCGSSTCCRTSSRPTWTARWTGAAAMEASRDAAERSRGADGYPAAPDTLRDLSHRKPARPLLASPRASGLRRFLSRAAHEEFCHDRS